MRKHLALLLLFLVPLLIAIEPPVMLGVTTKQEIDAKTEVTTEVDTRSYQFHCPTNGVCKFVDTELPDTLCSTEDWSAVIGEDADVCDNRRFNGDGSDGRERVLRTDLAGHTDSTTVDIILDIEYRGNQEVSTASAFLTVGTAASPVQCLVGVTSNGPPEDLGMTGASIAVSAFRNIGDRLQIMMRYDAVSGNCEIWVDKFGVRPGTGELANGTVAATSGTDQVFTSVRIENAVGRIDIIIRNFAWCAPGPCLL